MRTLTIALAAAALTLLPVQALASTPNPAPHQSKTEVHAAPSNDIQVGSTPLEGAKKPAEQTSTQSGSTVEPKLDQSAQTGASQHEASPAES